jgi:hypothetical protein
MASASPLPFAVAALLSCASCARPVVPEPQEALDRYLAAVRSGDDVAVYSMLTEASQRAYGREGVKRLLADSRSELTRRAASLASGKATIDTAAVIPYEDGEQAVLAVESGEFRVLAAGALPAGARTPAQALDELRQVLANARTVPAALLNPRTYLDAGKSQRLIVV